MDNNAFQNGVYSSHVGHVGHHQGHRHTEKFIRRENLIFSHNDSPVEFWAQHVEKRHDLVRLSEQLQLVGPGGPAVFGKPYMDKIYGTTFSSDGLWYRCRVVRYVSDISTEVLFVDYGNAEVKGNHDIRELPPNMATVPPYAHRYCLYGLKCNHEIDSMGYGQGCMMLLKTLGDCVLQCEVYQSSDPDTMPVVVRTDEIPDVNDEMVRCGFAAVATKHKPHVQHGHHVRNLLAEADMLLGNGVGGHQALKGIAGGGGGDGKLTAELARLRQEAQGAKREATTLKKQLKEANDKANKEKTSLQKTTKEKETKIGEMEVNMKRIQEDYVMLTTMQAEKSLSQRLTKLVQSVNKVKEYRVQFPTQEKYKDYIECAFEIVWVPERIRLEGISTLHNVEQAVKHYKAAQTAISASDNLESLEPILTMRDESRVKVYDEISKFIAEVDALPLHKRHTEIKEAVTRLEKTYKHFFATETTHDPSITTFEQAEQKYRDWKSQKLLEFQESRTRTNTQHNSVNHALITLQQHLSLESGVVDDKVVNSSNLDQLLDNFQISVKEEAKKTDLLSDVEDADASLVGTVLRLLAREMQQEVGDIEKAQRLQAEYSSMRDNLVPWLYVKPDLSPILDTRKQIKNIKSKLRHKLADLQDALENDESEDKQQAIRKDLSEIRHLLHKSFNQEDKFVEYFSELLDNHFPELALEHPDLGLETDGEHNGLVKQGRALDQFDLGPMTGSSDKTLYKTTYNHDDVVLKEYIVDERIGVKQTDFLRRAFYYNKIINDHVLSIESIFFTGGGRQAYIQLPCLEKSLAAVVEEGDVKPETCYHILRGVLSGLQAIHAANLVVGSIHPNNILINDEHEAVISELDFSKSPHQRVGSYISSSGLRFQPPEAQKNEISWASDMYNLGLLALWLHFPSYKFVLKSTGVPDYSPLEMEQSLEQLLFSLLQVEPASRRTSSSCWSLSYFTSSPHSPRHMSPSPHDSSKDTLQLRPKTDGKAPPKTSNGGILKKTGSCPTSSPPSLISPTGYPVQIKVEPAEISTHVENGISSSSSPVMDSPLVTPRNTPVEGESGSMSPSTGGSCGGSDGSCLRTDGLMHDAATRLSQTTHNVHEPDGEEVTIEECEEESS